MLHSPAAFDRNDEVQYSRVLYGEGHLLYFLPRPRRDCRDCRDMLLLMPMDTVAATTCRVG